MAFLLPLGEIATAATGLAAETFGEGAVSTAIGGAVAGKVSSAANQQQDSFLGQVEDKFKQTTGIDIRGKLGQAESTLQDFIHDITGETRYGTHALQRAGKTQTGTSKETITQKDELSSILAKKYVNSMKPENQCSCAPQVQQTAGSLPNSQGGITPLAGPNYHSPPQIVGSPVDVAQDTYANGVPQNKKIQVITPPGNGNQATGQLVLPPLVVTNLNKETGRKFGEFLAKSSFSTVNSGDTTGALQTVINNADYLPLANEWLQFAKVAKVDPEYAGLARVYNGKNLGPDSAFVNSDGKFCFRDEVGKVHVYTGKSAPKGTSTIGLIAKGFIPPIYGTWMGPESPNNELPAGCGANANRTQRFDFLDLCSMAHDIDYQEGYFHLEGDLKYISRLTQNMNRMNVQQQILAQFAIKWFSSVGYGLAKMVQSLPKDVDKKITDQSANDFYSFMVSKEAQKGVPKTKDYGKTSVNITSNLVNPQLRMQFYEGVREAVQKQYVQCAPSSTNPAMPQYNQGSLGPLGGLMVVSLNA